MGPQSPTSIHGGMRGQSPPSVPTQCHCGPHPQCHPCPTHPTVSPPVLTGNRAGSSDSTEEAAEGVAVGAAPVAAGTAGCSAAGASCEGMAAGRDRALRVVPALQCPQPLHRTGTHHTKWQFLVQRVVGEVMQRHGGRQCGSVVRRRVREACDGVLLPSQVHVIVYPLQRLWVKQLGWEEHPKLHLPDAMKTQAPWAPCPPPPAYTHRGCRRTRPQGGGRVTSPAHPSTPTHHAWMLGLERYELPQGGHVGRLVGGHWRRGWVQDVMVAGDDGGECLVGDGKLLHGTCLNQL